MFGLLFHSRSFLCAADEDEVLDSVIVDWSFMLRPRTRGLGPRPLYRGVPETPGRNAAS